MYQLLLVDDEWTQRYALVKIIREYNNNLFILKEAENGQEALELFENNSFDAIITDIRMPVIDGIQLLQRIHERNNNIPVALASTYSDFEYAQQGIKYGALDYIVKPLEKEKVFSILDQIKLLLDDKVKYQNIQYNIDKTLAEKLDFGLQEDYEDTIYNIVLNDSQILSAYIKDLANRYLAVYNEDYFKLCVMFEMIIKNIENRMLCSYEFIRNIYVIGNSSKEYFFSHNSKEAAIKAATKELLRISEFINFLHLNQEDYTIKQLIEYVLLKTYKKPTLEEAATLLNYSDNYLGRLFKLKTGESFSKFCAKVKLEHAKKLLKTKLYKSYEISEMLGYKDTEYFSRLFKEYTGITPSEYKKAHTGSEK